MRSRTRRGPNPYNPPQFASVANESRTLIMCTIWANHVILQARITASVTTTGQGKGRRKNELESVERREGIQIKLCLMRKVCPYQGFL